MISIRSSLAELEKCHEERDVAVDCYLTAIKSAAHYIIELDPSITEPQRKYLEALASEVMSGDPEVLGESRATLRGLLRDYRDKAAHHLKRLHEELDATANAMEQILSSLSQPEGDHESRMRAALVRIRELSRSPDAGPMGALLLAQDGNAAQRKTSRRSSRDNAAPPLAKVRSWPPVPPAHPRCRICW